MKSEVTLVIVAILATVLIFSVPRNIADDIQSQRDCPDGFIYDSCYSSIGSQKSFPCLSFWKCLEEKMI